MSLVDKAKDLASKANVKAREVAGPLADKVGPRMAEKAGPLAERASHLATRGVDTAATRVDKATGGKYHDKIFNVHGKLTDALSHNGKTAKPGNKRGNR